MDYYPKMRLGHFFQIAVLRVQINSILHFFVCVCTHKPLKVGPTNYKLKKLVEDHLSALSASTQTLNFLNLFVQEVGQIKRFEIRMFSKQTNHNSPSQLKLFIRKSGFISSNDSDLKI
ncbi:hypothetical protein BpHYR1_025032 [Brachionus plicatilis]|uniref:Uncharacterized protein n=1 Tax=Brachionus plicatilis TaxID=10195 RepID=A0A3M7RP57_BRAPC|nr:hypothetical protein BpHYR1_025032 [Brachionus plicatilis]